MALYDGAVPVLDDFLEQADQVRMTGIQLLAGGFAVLVDAHRRGDFTAYGSITVRGTFLYFGSLVSAGAFVHNVSFVVVEHFMS